MKHLSRFILLLLIIGKSSSIPFNSSVISKYATVSKWGTTDSGIEVARSSGRNMQNYRIESSKSISPTAKKKTPSVVYHYPIYQKPDAKIDKQIEHVPGIGEVIVQQAQDRFEARPLFAYKNKLSSSYGPPSAPKPAVQAPAAVQAPPPAPSSPIAPPPRAVSSLYDSPFTSYNPPDFKQDDSAGGDQFPPINSGDNAGLAPPPPPTKSSSSSTESPKANADSYASLGPPFASYGSHDGPRDYDQKDAPVEDPMAMYKNHDEGPPDYPPKGIDDVYYPPDFPKDQINHEMKDDHGQDSAPAPDPMPEKDEPKANDHEQDSMDLAPPPVHGYKHAFPDYLYDHHHYDNHVYEEIPHTTMPPAKEDKRVSTTHYSYYFLGRIAWYIPLYFSVYFIIYVTVLIIKSIARHKVKIKYKWYEHDINAKQARSLDLNSAREDHISDIHRNVSVALKDTTEKYGKVV